MNNKGNGSDFRSESEVCQNLNSIDSFGNNISPSYSDEKEVKIPTKVSGKKFRACIEDRNNLINLVESGEAVKMGRSYQSNALGFNMAMRMKRGRSNSVSYDPKQGREVSRQGV